MPGCSDACSCNIQAGDGVEIIGSGTPSNPFVITAVSDLGQSFRVNDTATINLTLTGSGTPTDAFTLRGDATIKMTQLADVSDPEGGPAEGDVPVWVGTGAGAHFEFKPPPTAPAGAVNVGAGITGTGAIATPIAVKTLNAPGGPTTGLEVYVDTAGNLRAVTPTSTAVDWSAITNKPSLFPPSAHTHVAADITDPTNLSVGNSLKVGGHTIFVQSATPSGAVLDDLWFY
jgi:hypothetical protein